MVRRLDLVNRLLTGVLISNLIVTSLMAETIEFDANESPPYWSESMPTYGMCGEILFSLSKRIGIEATIRFQPLQRLIDKTNNNDLGNPSFYIKTQDFSAIVPIAIFNSAFYYYRPHHPQGINIQSWQDLARYKVGLLKGSLSQKNFFKHAGINFEESYTQASLFKKLKLKRVDIVIAIDLVAMSTIEKIFPEEQAEFISISIKDAQTPIALLIDVDYPNGKELGERYQSALKQMIKEGSYQAIVEKYYGDGMLPPHWLQSLDKFQLMYQYVVVE